MKYTIRKKGEKYLRKFKPSGADIVGYIVVIIAIVYIIFEVIRG